MSSGALNDLPFALSTLALARAPIAIVGPTTPQPAIHLVDAIASRLGAAILTTPDAASTCFTAGHRSEGICSFGATARARKIAAESDVVLLVGANAGEFGGRGGESFPRARVVHVTDDPSELCIHRPAAVSLVGDVASILGKLADALPHRAEATPWFDELQLPPAPPLRQRAPSRGIDPEDAMRAIADGVPAEARIACDITTAALVLLNNLPLSAKTALWLQIERSACLGTALAAGLGIRVASGLPTLALLGDWGLMAAASELHTVATLGLGGFVILAWANDGSSMIRNGVQHQQLDVPAELHTWASPSFAKIAEGFGLRGAMVRTAESLRDAVREGMGASAPLLVHAVIDPEAEIPGAADRFDDLNESWRSE